MLLLVAAALVLVVVVGTAVASVVRGGSEGDELVGPQGLVVTEPGPTREPGREPLWTVDLDCDQGSCQVEADGERVYVTYLELTGDTDTATSVIAYDARTGDEEWTYEIDSGFGVTTVTPLGPLVSSDDELTLLDPGTGEPRWTDDGGGYGYVRDGLALVSREDDEEGLTSAAFDARSGEEVWTADVLLVPCGDRVVGVEDFESDEVVALDPRTGETRWTADIEGSLTVGSCSGDALVYQSGADELTLLDLDDGEPLGTVAVDDLPLRGDDPGDLDEVVNRPTLVVHGTDLYVVTDDAVTAHTRRGGRYEQAWTADREGGSPREHLVVDGGLVVVGAEGRAQRFRLRDGEVQGEARLGEGEVHLTTESLLVQRSRTVEAFALGDLEQRWALPVDGVRGLAAGGSRLFVTTEDGVEAYG